MQLEVREIPKAGVFVAGYFYSRTDELKLTRTNKIAQAGDEVQWVRPVRSQGFHVLAVASTSERAMEAASRKLIAKNLGK